MTVLADAEQHHIEQGRRVEPRDVAKIAQRLLVGGGSLLWRKAFGWHRVDIARWHRRAGEQRRMHHAEVAVWMVVRNEALVAPEPVHA